LNTAELHDVVVIGAGPAGSIAAEHLASRGHDVVVLEEHDTIGTPVHCTGLLGFDAFEQFALPRSIILGLAGTARFWGATGQSVSVHSHRVQAAVIDRAALDRALAGRATAAGATIKTGCRAETVDVVPEAVTVTVNSQDRPIRARALVLACGASYRFHRQLGFGLPDVFLQSAQLETEFPEMTEVEVAFGRQVAPAGFAWLVPFKRGNAPYARIGLMCNERSGAHFSSFLDVLCARAGVARAEGVQPRQKILPLGPVRRTYGDRVVAVGDAAGLVKPTTGGGIYYGLLSGALAADVLSDALMRNRLSSGHLRKYEARWRKRLGQEIRVGLAFRRIAARLSDESIDALIDLARVNGVVPLLQETASFNWHRKAAIALLGHPAFRRIVFKTWVGSADPL
jgi:digeranylgeranylglycerophospholipid reductase